MKEEYEIDLLDAKDKSAYRYIDEECLHIPVYKVELSFETSTAMYRDVYLIDGNTGEMLHKAKRPLWEDPFNFSEPIEAEYLRMKEDTDNEPIEKEDNLQSRDEDDKDDEIEI